MAAWRALIGSVSALLAWGLLVDGAMPVQAAEGVRDPAPRSSAVAISAQRMRGKALGKRGVVRKANASQSGAYGFVEFIARRDIPMGHAYIRYGRLKRGGKPIGVRYSGLYPKYGLAGKVAGGIIPIASTTGRTPDDVPSQTINSFRRNLSRAEYARLNSRVRASQQDRGYWHAALHNCNDFVGAFARSVGMTTPPLSWMPSPMYIGAMKLMNGS